MTVDSGDVHYEAFVAILRCDGRCGQFVSLQLTPEQAERYCALIDRRHFDAAMGVLREPGTYPSGWMQRPEVVGRNVAHLDHQTGEVTARSEYVQSFVDFCPDCQRRPPSC